MLDYLSKPWEIQCNYILLKKAIKSRKSEESIRAFFGDIMLQPEDAYLVY